MQVNITMKKIILITLAVSALVSCEDEQEECISYQEVPAVLVNGPTSGLIDQDISLSVSLTYSNGCGFFDRFESTASGDSILIKTTGKYQGCVCTQDLPTRVSTYNFRSARTGDFVLIFPGIGSDTLYHSISIR